MAKRCELTGMGVMVGNNVSHSHRKTKRRFLPNLQKVTFKSDALGQNVSLKVATKTLRTVNKYGSIDSFLINFGFAKLSEEAKTLRKRVKDALVRKGLYENVKIKSKKEDRKAMASA